MKKKHAVISGSLLCGVLGLYVILNGPVEKNDHLDLTSSDVSQIKKDKKATPLNSDRDIASIPNSTQASNGSSMDLNAIYKEKYLNGEEAKILADKSDEIFKNSKFKEQIKKWNVLGLYFSNSDDYVALMNENIDVLKANSPEILDDILAAQEEVAKDPFMEQMVLSLVYTLDVSSERKSDYAGKILSRKIDFESGEVNESALNINSAFAYLKQEGTPDSIVSDYIAKGLEKNQDNAEAYEAYTARVQAYYPDLVQF